MAISDVELVVHVPEKSLGLLMAHVCESGVALGDLLPGIIVQWVDLNLAKPLEPETQTALDAVLEETGRS